MKKFLLVLLFLFCVASTVFATTITKTYTIQDKLFKPCTYGFSAKCFLYTGTGRVIYYRGNNDEVDVAKVYFSIKIGGKYMFSLDGDEIKSIEGILW